ncbi:PREDICTED: MAGUK p55 subfamily member 5-like isoform X2 [Priapulus caudatus]|uniref:MAGUK p55 subfamily member 5-like isoform X2 n=1 Tax=Priapulus caudatus TaxID=37621 RepID=A0ABM1F3E5_PRICU|nr:PREDICTED: MAGUK p55 subfamily member 5-like isoform X2 [Priapulus caudatus]
MKSFGKQANVPAARHNGHAGATANDTYWDIKGPQPHREVAVDVPDGFVGQSKVPPRYPTPQRPSVAAAASPTHRQGAPDEAASVDQLERIRMYQEDLRKRKEEEDRHEREAEFLRNSLRGSEKLKALMSNTPVSGIENIGYEEEDGSDGFDPMDIVGTTPPRRPIPMIELMGSLSYIQHRLEHSEHREELSVLARLFRNVEFQKAIGLHNQVVAILSKHKQRTPATTEAESLTQEVLKMTNEVQNSNTRELQKILSNPTFQGLMFSHDKLSLCSQVPPVTPEYNNYVERAADYVDGHENIRIVRLEKTSEPLGATVKNEGSSVIVGRIVKGGAAEKSGLIHEGDEVLEINGIDMRGKSVNEVVDIMATLTGQLTFLIKPSSESSQLPHVNREAMMHVKAHFNYDPEDDLYIPCRELGIGFQKGDILHVINQEDSNWWQAYREGEEDQPLAGLIPSRSFTQQREAMRQTIAGDLDNPKDKKKNKMLCAKKHAKKKKKSMYNANFNEDFDSDEILAYEEVALYFPRPHSKRPVILIGPQNIGRHELRQRLMESDSSRYAAAIPHTSRPKKDSEIDGVHYHFVPRHTFEADILARRFVEHGEFERNYYGTSVASVRRVVNDRRICVLNLQPQSLKILKSSDLMPYVVFVAPPGLEKLRQTRLKLGMSTKDDDLRKIIEEAREMEENYGHYFDKIIVNYDLDRAYDDLQREIKVIETEPQWVPAAWTIGS